tara:strand:- start:435 stop:1223 length:789 start_codon:yes stop_codon:yes gene_type:complete
MVGEYLRSGGLTHIHTDLSKDGCYTVSQISQFIKRNLTSGYFAIADHLTSPYSDRAYPVRDVSLRVTRMFNEVLRYNLGHPTEPVCISGVEVNIKPSGLDIPNVILEEISFVVASRHFPWGNETRTAFENDMERAMNNPHVDVIGHIDKYAPQKIDWEHILGVAKDTKTIIEINFETPPTREILSHIKRLQLPVTLGVDFHTFNGGNTADDLPLSYNDIKRVVQIVKQIATVGIEPKQIVNLRCSSDFINLLKTKKNDRRFE